MLQRSQLPLYTWRSSCQQIKAHSNLEDYLFLFIIFYFQEPGELVITLWVVLLRAEVDGWRIHANTVETAVVSLAKNSWGLKPRSVEWWWGRQPEETHQTVVRSYAGLQTREHGSLRVMLKSWATLHFLYILLPIKKTRKAARTAYFRQAERIILNYELWKTRKRAY